MARVFRVQQLNGDGSSAEDRPFDFYPDVDKDGKPYLNDDGLPAIAITMRPVSKEKHREFVKTRTTVEANGSGVMVEKTDFLKVDEDIVAHAILDWRGFVGADDRPLKCVDATKRALDPALLNAVRNKAIFAQPAEVTAESFRQPPPVPGVVGGLRQDDVVLPAGDAAGTERRGAAV